MKLLHLFVINAMLVPYCTALLKCRREVVGTVRGAQPNAQFNKEECPRKTGGTWLNPDPQHKYCMVTYCTKGYDWITVYGCTSTNERNWCSNQLGINLKKSLGAFDCRNCTLGGENENYGNMHFALHPPETTTTTTPRVPPKTTTTTATKKVPEMTTTEFIPLIWPDHGTGLKIALPLVFVGLAIFCGTFFGHSLFGVSFKLTNCKDTGPYTGKGQLGSGQLGTGQLGSEDNSALDNSALSSAELSSLPSCLVPSCPTAELSSAELSTAELSTAELYARPFHHLSKLVE
uniref:Uncharacterized protein n=1 Tax=Globodera rostochiensis TaxID=31243 RepID=A0A914IFE5_GLORO